MNAMLDDALVGLLLLASIVYAFVKLSPKNVRRRVNGRLAEWLARAPQALRLASLTQHLARAAVEKSQGACGGCDNCAPESKPQSNGTEIRVPIAGIVRRPTRQE